jgi:DDE superfamily endonuclease
VIFSDECYVHVSDKCGRIFVTQRKDEQLLDECVVPTFKQSKLHVMIWGCIAQGQKGPLVMLDYPGGKGGGMNSKRYQQQVLEDVFLDFYTHLKQLRTYIQFQQDNAPRHTSKSILAWLAHYNIPLFFHPPNSPDLSTIEPVWLELKHILQHQSHSLTTIDELQQFVHTAWDEISVDKINKHIGHMPDRAAAVLGVKGGHTCF